MKNIAIKDVKAIADKVGLTHVVVYGYDGCNEWVCTYGKTIKQCAEAAKAGNFIKKALGWKQHLDAEPSRVKALKEENKKLKQRIKELEVKDSM